MVRNNQDSIVLSKSSSNEDLKRYFTAVLELSKTDNKFPINLDEVWPLVYSERGKAIRALRGNFIEEDDYVAKNQVLAQNGKNSEGRPKTDYFLSLSCLEYFIARKVRPVFEVYRKVFHKAAETPILASYQIEDPIERAKRWIAEQEEKKLLECKTREQKLLIKQQETRIEIQDRELKDAAPKVSFYDEVMQSADTMTTTQVAKSIGMEANALNRKLRDIGILYNQSGMWMLCAPYSRWNLHSMRTQAFTRYNGSIGTSRYTVWNNRGFRFIHALYENEWNIRKAIKSINPGWNESQKAERKEAVAL